MIDTPDSLPRLTQPAYTGENRCLPCTVVNVVVAAGVATGVGIIISAPLGAAAFVVFLVVIALRGYLVPGTPTLTQRYLPARIRSLFGKESDPRPTIDADLDGTLRSLSAAGVLTGTSSASDPELAAEFRSQWDERLSESIPAATGTADTADETGGAASEGDVPDADIAVEPAAIAALFDADTAVRRGDATVELDGTELVRWPSAAALAADVAADRELGARLAGWNSLDVDERRDVLTGLRILRERCPVCDGSLSRRVDRLEHCCRRPQIGIERVCRDCDRPLVSVAVPADSAVLEWVPAATGDEERERRGQ